MSFLENVKNVTAKAKPEQTQSKKPEAQKAETQATESSKETKAKSDGLSNDVIKSIEELSGKSSEEIINAINSTKSELGPKEVKDFGLSKLKWVTCDDDSKAGEPKLADSKTEELKSKVLNEDGSINSDSIIEYFESDNFSIYDLEQAVGGKVSEQLTMNDNVGNFYTRTIELPNGEFIRYEVQGKAGEETEYIQTGKAEADEKYGGTSYNYYDYSETDNRFDLSQTEAYKEEKEKQAAEQEKIKNLASSIINENGSINYENVGNLINSGEMSVPDFLAANGYDLTNENDQRAICLNMSSEFSYTMADGTKVTGCTSSWGNESEHIKFTTPNGEEYYFEVN